MDTTMTTPSTTTTSTEGGNIGKEQYYFGFVIGILLPSIAALLAMVLYCILRRSAPEEMQQNGTLVGNAVRKDDPPIYGDLMQCKEPPDYHESIMQTINPEYNRRYWNNSDPNAASAKGSTTSLAMSEVNETILRKVRSQKTVVFYQWIQNTLLASMGLNNDTNQTQTTRPVTGLSSVATIDSTQTGANFEAMPSVAGPVPTNEGHQAMLNVDRIDTRESNNNDNNLVTGEGTNDNSGMTSHPVFTVGE